MFSKNPSTFVICLDHQTTKECIDEKVSTVASLSPHDYWKAWGKKQSMHFSIVVRGNGTSGSDGDSKNQYQLEVLHYCLEKLATIQWPIWIGGLCFHALEKIDVQEMKLIVKILQHWVETTKAIPSKRSPLSYISPRDTPTLHLVFNEVPITTDAIIEYSTFMDKYIISYKEKNKNILNEKEKPKNELICKLIDCPFIRIEENNEVPCCLPLKISIYHPCTILDGVILIVENCHMIMSNVKQLVHIYQHLAAAIPLTVNLNFCTVSFSIEAYEYLISTFARDYYYLNNSNDDNYKQIEQVKIASNSIPSTQQPRNGAFNLSDCSLHVDHGKEEEEEIANNNSAHAIFSYCSKDGKFLVSKRNIENCAVIKNYILAITALKAIDASICNITFRDTKISISAIQEIISTIMIYDVKSQNSYKLQEIDIHNCKFSSTFTGDSQEIFFPRIHTMYCRLEKKKIIIPEHSIAIGNPGSLYDVMRLLTECLPFKNIITELVLEQNQEITDKGLEIIAKYINKTNINNINLCRTLITDQGLIEFADMVQQEGKTKFVHLNVTGNPISAYSIRYILQHLGGLKELVANDIKMRNNDAKDFATIMKANKNNTITHLELSWNTNVTGEGWNYIMKVPSIRSLSIHGLRSSSVEQMKNIAEALEGNTHLERLDISRGNLRNEHLECILNVFQSGKNKTLKHLHCKSHSWENPDNKLHDLLDFYLKCNRLNNNLLLSDMESLPASLFTYIIINKTKGSPSVLYWLIKKYPQMFSSICFENNENNNKKRKRKESFVN